MTNPNCRHSRWDCYRLMVWCKRTWPSKCKTLIYVLLLRRWEYVGGATTLSGTKSALCEVASVSSNRLTGVEPLSGHIFNYKYSPQLNHDQRNTSSTTRKLCFSFFFGFFLAEYGKLYVALTEGLWWALHVSPVESYCCFVEHYHRGEQLLVPVMLGVEPAGPDERSFLQRCSPRAGGHPEELFLRR